MLTGALAFYRFAHRARCLVNDYCYPCDAPAPKFYWISLAIDAYGMGLATVKIIEAIKG